MSVFTKVTHKELEQWLKSYSLGDLVELRGISAGITNTNYFVTTSDGRYVLTLFEEHTPDELPYFLDLMTHLANHGIPCPHPVINHEGSSLGTLNAKPAALVSRLSGSDIESPSVQNCSSVGNVLAQMHIVGQGFKGTNKNSRDSYWRQKTSSKVMEFLDEHDRKMLLDTLEMQNDFHSENLPRGVIHADLFRDNVLFDGNEIGGIIDFYYACNDYLLYDIAIAVNDWCIDEDGNLDDARYAALLKSYHHVRPLTEDEANVWPQMLQFAALRFWLSRLYDKHFPVSGELTHAKDPQHFQKVLKHRIHRQESLSGVL